MRKKATEGQLYNVKIIHQEKQITKYKKELYFPQNYFISYLSFYRNSPINKFDILFLSINLTHIKYKCLKKMNTTET